MDRLGLLLLSILSRNEADDKKTAMTTNEITDIEYFSYKYNTVYKKMVQLEKMGCAASGYKDGNARAFYITKYGRETLKNS